MSGTHSWRRRAWESNGHEKEWKDGFSLLLLSCCCCIVFVLLLLCCCCCFCGCCYVLFVVNSGSARLLSRKMPNLLRGQVACIARIPACWSSRRSNGLVTGERFGSLQWCALTLFRTRVTTMEQRKMSFTSRFAGIRRQIEVETVSYYNSNAAL